MSPPQAGLVTRLWFRWKALQLPWRKQFLRGYDLSGNTFWEFKDELNAGRWRRIVKYANKTPHYADVKVSTQWHQWLRHTRRDPPTIAEQQSDIARQETMKRLAAQADERWKSIPSYFDVPRRPSLQQPVPAIGVEDPGGYVQQTVPEANEGVRSAVDDQAKVEAATQGKGQEELDEGSFKGNHAKDKVQKAPKENPWAYLQAKGSAGENWQPGAWRPGVAPRGK